MALKNSTLGYWPKTYPYWPDEAYSYWPVTSEYWPIYAPVVVSANVYGNPTPVANVTGNPTPTVNVEAL